MSGLDFITHKTCLLCQKLIRNTLVCGSLWWSAVTRQTLSAVVSATIAATGCSNNLIHYMQFCNDYANMSQL